MEPSILQAAEPEPVTPPPPGTDGNSALHTPTSNIVLKVENDNKGQQSSDDKEVASSETRDNSNERDNTVEGEEEGYAVFLSNIPENARVANIFGAIRKQVGEFKSVNLAKIRNGICKLCLKEEDTRDKIVKNPINLFGVTLKCSMLNPDIIPESFHSVYMANIPKTTTVKKLMGTIRSVIGEFTAMNKLIIETPPFSEFGHSKISFDKIKHQKTLLANGLTGSLSKVILAKQPLRCIPSSMGHEDMQNGSAGFMGLLGTKREFQDNAFGMLKRPRFDGGGVMNGLGGGRNQMGDRPQMTPYRLEELELENEKLKLEVKYLRDRLNMYEKRLYPRREPQHHQRMYGGAPVGNGHMGGKKNGEDAIAAQQQQMLQRQAATAMLMHNAAAAALSARNNGMPNNYGDFGGQNSGAQGSSRMPNGFGVW